MTPEEMIAEALRLDAEATPGPWEAEDLGEFHTRWPRWEVGAPPQRDPISAARTCKVIPSCMGDAAFIARARTLLPALARLCEVQRKALEAVPLGKYDHDVDAQGEDCTFRDRQNDACTCHVALVRAALKGETP